MATKTKILKKKVETTNLETKNKDATTQKVVINRKLKYIYPKGCIDTLKRKAYRQQVRNKIRGMEAEISKLRGEDRRILKAKLEEYAKEHLS